MSRKVSHGWVFSLLILLSAPALAAEEKPLTIGLIGDSTVASTYGWGPSFAEMVTERTKVLNYARNGATLQSLSKKLDELLLQKPDYVLIQFGHNDQKRYDTSVYGAELTSYVERVKNAGGKPIVLSSVTRRGFDDNDKILPRDGNDIVKAPLPVYAKKAEAVAKQQNVPFLDLYTISVAHHNKIGPAESAKYNPTATDITHFTKQGADAIAELVVAELKVVAPALAPHLK
ncbi:rhamnogalacturonan acetylesterase [Blastopirellula sp. J2-11]|uniref:rhamnogalacturonan acetylesterase n=1 Tax=Blastopirellula sp. J2-11 TaxID=2943192 RepID=UPI0021CAAEE5|nr:rhamnogalacturonan acetylesterase [Blastopirellula sp. J2-11]UUO04612.1 rhamnogalacturonan acetylesterase [Blastopirellula sp. J2-11]